MEFLARFVEIPHIGDYLSVADIALTVVGFTVTVIMAWRAKSAASLALDAANRTRRQLLHIEVVAEMASAHEQVEELKRLQRAKSIDTLQQKYSTLRARLILVRESGILAADADLVAIQDTISRLAALERLLDQNPRALDSAKQMVKCNESLSVCIDSITAIRARVRG